MRRDTRGVSTAISHVLSLGVVAILIVGLISGVGGLLDSEQRSAQTEQIDAVGSRLASDIADADRLARGGSSVVLDASGPRAVASDQYTVRLVPDSDAAKLSVETAGRGPSTTLAIDPETEVCEESFASGGSVAVVVENGCLTLEDR